MHKIWITFRVNYIRFHKDISIRSWKYFWKSIKFDERKRVKIDVCKNVGYIEQFKRDDEARRR